MKKLIILFVCIIFINHASFSQSHKYKYKFQNPSNPFLAQYSPVSDNNGWVQFRKNVKRAEFLAALKTKLGDMGLKGDNKLIDKKSQNLGPTLDRNYDVDKEKIRLNQYFNGIPVEDAQLLIHFDSLENVSLIHGMLAEGLNAHQDKISISKSKAIEKALSEVAAKVYAWEDPDWEEQIQRDENNPDATHYPSGELIYARKNQSGKDFSNDNLVLSYKFIIRTLEPDDVIEIIINAKTEKLVRRVSLLQSDVTGTVQTLYNGTRSLTTDHRGFPNFDYVLRDHGRGDKIHTKLYTSSAWWVTNEVDDKNNMVNDRSLAATAHWGVEMAWDYFSSAHSRNGMDNSGGKIRVEPKQTYINARYNRYGDYLHFGHSSTDNPLLALDIIGHEFTHGVTRYSSDLNYNGESGALNESFSDIFGVMVERSIEGVANWTFGEDANWLLRSLQNPNSFIQPDTYEGLWWADPNCFGPSDGNDFCGVHTNSGVQNYWFFLLSNGGIGTNDNGDNFSVQNIGITAAARIAYRNLTVYLQPSSDYQDARAGAINAAIDLYGNCSNQHIAVVNAWHAVGVGAAFTQTCLTASITGPSGLNLNSSGTWYANVSGNGSNYTYRWWQSTNGGYETLVSSSSSVSRTLTSTSGMTLRLVVTSGNGTIAQANKNVYCANCGGGGGGEPCGGASLSVYPNPFQQTINLVLKPIPCASVSGVTEPELAYTVRIYDEKNGRLVLEEEIQAGDTAFNPNLKRGSYTLYLTYENKIIMEHLIKE